MVIQWRKDLKFTIRKRQFPQGIVPLHPQEECVIETALGKLNDLCANCIFCAARHFTRRVNELGIHGFMSNADENKGTVNALKPGNLMPSEGIKLRDPTTSIIEDGERYICQNRKAGERIYIVGEETPSCEQFRSRPEPKK